MVGLIKKWARHIFSRKVLNIIEGNFNRLFNRELHLRNSRMPICEQCPKRELVYKVGYICSICGCPLESKTRSKTEQCDLNYWKE
jgi:hypothetical protein